MKWMFINFQVKLWETEKNIAIYRGEQCLLPLFVISSEYTMCCQGQSNLLILMNFWKNSEGGHIWSYLIKNFDHNFKEGQRSVEVFPKIHQDWYMFPRYRGNHVRMNITPKRAPLPLWNSCMALDLVPKTTYWSNWPSTFGRYH